MTFFSFILYISRLRVGGLRGYQEVMGEWNEAKRTVETGSVFSDCDDVTS